MVRKMIRTDFNYKKEDWGLFSAFSMVAAQMDPNDKKIRVLAMEVEPVTIKNPNFCEWTDHRWDATLESRPARSIATRRSGTSNIDQSFW